MWFLSGVSLPVKQAGCHACSHRVRALNFRESIVFQPRIEKEQMMRIFFACNILVISCFLFSGTCSVAQADLITFGREHVVGNSLIDELTSGSITRGGLTATFTANLGVLNANGTSFGINDLDSADDPARLDTFNGVVEFITVTFDQPVTFTQLTLQDFSPGETAILKIGPNVSPAIDPLTAAIDAYDFTNDGYQIALGQSLVISSGVGNGFSLESFQVNTVPEPSCLSVALPALAALLVRRKRKAKCFSQL